MREFMGERWVLLIKFMTKLRLAIYSRLSRGQREARSMIVLGTLILCGNSRVGEFCIKL